MGFGSVSQTMAELSWDRGIWMPSFYGDLKRVKEFIARDPNCVNYKDHSGYTPLVCASREGHTEVADAHNHVVRTLLEAKADPNLTTKRTQAVPLHRAAFMGHAGIVGLLLDHGGPCTSPPSPDVPVWHMRAARPLPDTNLPFRCHHLAVAGAAPLQEDVDGQHAFHKAIRGGHK
eukprot:gene787-2537_t